MTLCAMVSLFQWDRFSGRAKRRWPARIFWLLLTSAILAWATWAFCQSDFPETGQDPPFPAVDRELTLGEFLDLVSGPDLLALNLMVRDSVPKQKVLTCRLSGLSCREALRLVVHLERLKLEVFKPGVTVVGIDADKPLKASVRRTFHLDRASPREVLNHIRRDSELTARIDWDQVSVDETRRILTLASDPATLSRISERIGTSEMSGSQTAVIPLGFGSFDDLRSALAALGPEATAGINPDNLVYVKNQNAVLVNGTPDQLDRLRKLVSGLNVAPESVQIGVSSIGSSAESGSASGLDVGWTKNRVGGRVVYSSTKGSSSQSQVMWVTTLSGSPARFQLAQIFNIPIYQTTTMPGAPTLITAQPQEIPVGLTLEVIPFVAGQSVTVDLRLADESPLAVHSYGVDRASRVLITRVTLPRGGNTTIGGFRQALVQIGRSGVADLMTRRSSRQEDLTVFLSVR